MDSIDEEYLQHLDLNAQIRLLLQEGFQIYAHRDGTRFLIHTDNIDKHINDTFVYVCNGQEYDM